MATSTYTLIDSVTLTSSASSVTFSAIPAGGDLVLVANVLGPASSYFGLGLRFNGDSGSNYNFVAMTGSGSTTYSSAQTGNSSLSLGYFVTLFPGMTNVTISQIADYSASDKQKSVLTRANTPQDYLEALAGRWASTAAITSVEVMRYQGGGDFPAGCTFHIYNIAKEL
jgi:hypothetical protein